MEVKKNSLFMYVLVSIFVFTLCIGETKAANYENYFGIEMTNQEYNNLLNLGFSEDEIYYMDTDTFENNKDTSSNLVATNEKYYKTIYTGLDGTSYSTEITEDEYNNQGLIAPAGTVTTEYKRMVSTMSQTSSGFRYKVTVGWLNMPSVRSYDIIGVGFDDDIYISSSVYFSYTHCNSSGDCTTASDYYFRQKTSTGGSIAYKFPSGDVTSMTAVLYYDVAKNTSSTITELNMCGDYAHATTNVSYSTYSNHRITINGLELGSNASYYDAIPCAISTWYGSW